MFWVNYDLWVLDNILYDLSFNHMPVDFEIEKINLIESWGGVPVELANKIINLFVRASAGGGFSSPYALKLGFLVYDYMRKNNIYGVGFKYFNDIYFK